MMPRTIIEKIWDQHVIKKGEGKPDLLYIDLHLIHEVTSPQAFEGLRQKNRKVRRPQNTFATMDHNIPTVNRFEIKDDVAKRQVSALERNCEEFGIRLADLSSVDQGIVHVIGPELGLTLPGQNDRLRRQPYIHTRSVWRARFRNRNERSRTRLVNADALAAKTEDAGNPR